MSAIASFTTIAAATVTTIAMGVQVESSQITPPDLHVMHHDPPGPAQVELPQPAAPAVAPAAPTAPAAPAAARPVPAGPVPATADHTAATSCPTDGLDAGSALVRLPIRYLASWSALAEALGFVTIGGDAPISIREQLSGITKAIPQPTTCTP